MSKHGKKLRNGLKLFDRQTKYELTEAVELAKKISYVKFDETLEVHFNLGVNPRHADQNVRGTVGLPNGLGKTVRVVAFAMGDKATEAAEAGADKVGAQDLADEIKGGWLDFDAVVATPDMMKFVGPLGKILGPRGLMPNPKLGTTTFDIGKAVTELKAGKIEYRVDKYGIVHCPIGKISFTVDALKENFLALYDALIKARPATAKGTYVKAITICSAMGPGIKLEPALVKKSLESR